MNVWSFILFFYYYLQLCTLIVISKSTKTIQSWGAFRLKFYYFTFFSFQIFFEAVLLECDHAYTWRSNSSRFVLVKTPGQFNPSIITGSVYKISEITINIYYIMNSLFGLLLLLLLAFTRKLENYIDSDFIHCTF